ncbi:hypothetical protein T440DRAFT_556969 [Plenodomus tracheiphilus IPT5]|uniref:Uncharacterized protein n=1 Tax=Plenodomus tracheiphilus IPT5 TaxID=1408161 RepID=A0A6A7AZX9_9PLEO|nr:hypothetical protein T440DRAFT_556969 [Plenodomus tracheiphilus IPT5]
MPPYLSVLIALGTLSTYAAADNMYTYTQPGCKGCAFFFKDIDHNICAVTITGNATSIADAIEKGITSMASGKLEVQETGKKHFIGWDEGPESNDDGPLQCGTVSVNQAVEDRETCIDHPYEGKFHGFSWTEPGDNRKRASADVWFCTSFRQPEAVILKDGRHYKTSGIPNGDYNRLKALALANAGSKDLPSDLRQYEYTPSNQI